jgi:hypothetical protein
MTIEKIDIKNSKQFLNKNNTTREINHILSENGFVIQDFYVVENIKGIVVSNDGLFLRYPYS